MKTASGGELRESDSPAGGGGPKKQGPEGALGEKVNGQKPEQADRGDARQISWQPPAGNF